MGWVALGIGATQLLIPGLTAGLIHVRPRRRTTSMLRIIGAGVLLGGAAVIGTTYAVQARTSPASRVVTRAVTIGCPVADVRAALLRPDGDWMDLLSADLEHVFEETPQLRWRVPVGAGFDGGASVELRNAPGNRGTEMVVQLRYRVPNLAAVRAVRKLFGKDPSQKLGRVLARFKQLLETGTEARSDASIHRGMHAARPASASEETLT